MSPGPRSPALFRLASHQVRWRLLTELVTSDRQVRELSVLVGEQQSLTSYHLGRLRDGGFVTTRRSSADGRDTYYSLDLAVFLDAFVEAGAALHPGLRLVRSPQPTTPRPTSDAPAISVLFVCTGNSARSQMAEALLEDMGAPSVRARSAGSSPKPLHPSAVRVMSERGIDLQGRRAKHLDEFAGERFDHVITLCDRVREVCADLDGVGATAHWSLADPAAEARTSDDDEPFRRVADRLTRRIEFLLHGIAPGAAAEAAS